MKNEIIYTEEDISLEELDNVSGGGIKKVAIKVAKKVGMSIVMEKLKKLQ